MADASELDAAIVTALANDATLAGLLPDGVFWDIAPSGKTRFAIVSLTIHEDEYLFEGRAFERATYLVKAVDQNVSGAIVKVAAERIEELLQDVTLVVTGYTHMLTRRIERIRYTEVDEVNADIRWQHRGGRYEVYLSPEASGSPVGSP